MLNALEAASRAETSDSWAFYDIVKAGENDYRTVMTVAGFSQDELALSANPLKIGAIVIACFHPAEEDHAQSRFITGGAVARLSVASVSGNPSTLSLSGWARRIAGDLAGGLPARALTHLPTAAPGPSPSGRIGSSSISGGRSLFRSSIGSFDFFCMIGPFFDAGRDLRASAAFPTA